jgi:hypothetical protein
MSYNDSLCTCEHNINKEHKTVESSKLYYLINQQYFNNNSYICMILLFFAVWGVGVAKKG